MRHAYLAGLGALCAILLALHAPAADSPQFRGPQRNGVFTDPDAAAAFAQGGPVKVWSASIGAGFSSITVADGRVYTMGNEKEKDTVYCLNQVTGETIWSHTYPAKNYGGYNGPRSTPTVHDGRVYTLSAEARAFCFDAATGEIHWDVDLKLKNQNQAPQWGFSGAPLIITENNTAIYNVGPGGVALKLDSGDSVWDSGRGKSGYASPYRCTLDGQDTLLIFAGDGLMAVEPLTGKKLWFFEWKTQYDVNAADPVVVGDRVFISSNYRRGCALLEIKKNKVQKLYENKNMSNHFSTCVYIDGMLFGNDDGSLVCLDFNSGEVKWKQAGMGKGGSTILLNGKVMALFATGQLLTLEPDGERFQLLAKGQPLGGQCWTSPTVAGGMLFARNNRRGDLVAVKLQN